MSILDAEIHIDGRCLIGLCLLNSVQAHGSDGDVVNFYYGFCRKINVIGFPFRNYEFL